MEEQHHTEMDLKLISLNFLLVVKLQKLLQHLSLMLLSNKSLEEILLFIDKNNQRMPVSTLSNFSVVFGKY